MQVTKSEKNLLWILGLVVFGIVNYVGYDWLSKQQTTLQHKAASMRADQAEAKVDLLESDGWTRRKAWITQHEPVLGDEGDAKAQTLEAVLKGARDNKLDILEQNLNDVEHGAAGTQINVSVKVKGSMEAIVRWLTDLQKPEQFFAVSLFSLLADQDQKSMVCTLKVARYFKDKGGS